MIPVEERKVDGVRSPINLPSLNLLLCTGTGLPVAHLIRIGDASRNDLLRKRTRGKGEN